MINAECDSVRDVIRATQSNEWPEDVRAHAATCSRCQETIAMASMMKELSARELPHPLPNFRTVWLKARYARKQESLTKFDVLSLAGLSLVGIAGLAVLLMVIFPQLFRKIIDIPSISISQLTGAFSGGTPLLILAAVGALVWLLTKDSKYAG